MRRGEERRNDGIGDLIFDEVRAASGPVRKHDYLNVRQVGNRIERSIHQGPEPSGNGENDTQVDEELVPGAPLDDLFNHVRPRRLQRQSRFSLA